MSQTKAQLISDLVQALNFTGTSSAPANGVYLSATNTIKLATNSLPRITIGSNGEATFAHAVTISTATDQLLNLNSSDSNATYLAFQRGGTRISYFGYGGSGSTLTWANEVSDGDIHLSVNDGGSTITPLKIDASEGGIVQLLVSGTTRLATSSTGVTITGTCTATTFVGALTGTASGNAVLTGSTNNQLVTVTGANAITGEANLTFDGNQLFTQTTGSADPLVVNTTYANKKAIIRETSDNNSNSGLTIQKKHSTLHPNGYWYGDIRFEGWDGDQYRRAALIECVAEGTPADDNMPGQLRIHTNPGQANQEERIRITKDGNVGVGTTSPDSLLHLKKTSGAKMTIECDDNNDAWINFSGASNEMSVGFDKTINSIIVANADTIQSNQRLVITSAGKVGIGTTSPDNNLHIHAGSCGTVDSTASSALTLEKDNSVSLQFLTPNDSVAQIRFGDPQDTGIGWIQYAHGTNEMKFGAYGPEKLTIKSGGDLDIYDGNLVVASGHGIDFSATSGPNESGATGLSELFADYEQGSFTPVFEYLDTSNNWQSVAFDNALDYTEGQYTKIGNMVYGWFYSGYFTVTTAADDRPARIHGLPYTYVGTSPYYGGNFHFVHTSCFGDGSGTAVNVTGGYCNYSDNYINVLRSQPGISGASWYRGGHYTMFSFAYQAA